jgi:hypothetical protein
METYVERINRFRIVRRVRVLSRAEAAQYRLNGMDPEDSWELVWSFEHVDSAENQMKKYSERGETDEGSYYIYKMVDAGKAEEITRQAWF